MASLFSVDNGPFWLHLICDVLFNINNDGFDSSSSPSQIGCDFFLFPPLKQLDRLCIPLLMHMLLHCLIRLACSTSTPDLFVPVAIIAVIFVASSPWYNPIGWLGVKHQFTYSSFLSSFSFAAFCHGAFVVDGGNNNGDDEEEVNIRWLCFRLGSIGVDYTLMYAADTNSTVLKEDLTKRIPGELKNLSDVDGQYIDFTFEQEVTRGTRNDRLHFIDAYCHKALIGIVICFGQTFAQSNTIHQCTTEWML